MKATYVDQEGKFLPVKGEIMPWSYQFWLLYPPSVYACPSGAGSLK
jgi:hypothetical protein